MEIVKTSLDALLQRATNPLNQNVDEAAVEAFCGLVNKERDGCHIGVKLLAARLHSKEEREVLQTLNVLDTCMQKCGNSFRSEVGKFRFLNEMIKLVSPKYLGLQTPMTVRHKVVRMIFWWTYDYPKETKITEAYEMLRKQGLIKEVTVNLGGQEQGTAARTRSSVFCDEEKSKLLRKLLQSKNPEDLQAANRLIKCMVKEDDKRAELKSRKLLEVQTVYSTVTLLKELLNSYNKNGGTTDDVALIREMYQNCERLRPKIHMLATECQQNDDMIGDLLVASDELNQVFEDYKRLIIEGKTEFKMKNLVENGPSLLDLGVNKTDEELLLEPNQVSNDNSKPGYEDLCDIFSSINNASTVTENDILKPTVCNDPQKINGKLKAFEELDALGESLMKQNLQRQGHQFQKNPDKVPMNMLTKQNSTRTESKEEKPDPLNFDLSYLLEKQSRDPNPVQSNQNGADDLLVDITEDFENEKSPHPETPPIKEEESKPKLEMKLSDLAVALEDIKPSTVPPVTALEEKNGISVTLHFAKDKPRDDVMVVVVTIVSKNELPLKNVLFRAIVPKVCKVKLQSASATDLPPFNPFLPPSAITQIMLISNPAKVNVSLKFIVSYNIEDETTTEMGEVDSLPNV